MFLFYYNDRSVETVVIYVVSNLSCIINIYTLYY